jgi:hypothetical protein
MGTEINVHMDTHTTINFRSVGSEMLEDEVAAQVSRPSAIGMSIYNCFGFSAGRAGKPTFS